MTTEVEFASKDEAFQVLKGKSKLKGSNVFINPDYTRRQQELNKSAQQQLIQRRSNGEVAHIQYIKAGQDINLVILAAAYFPPKSPVAAYVAFNEEVDRICEEFPTAHLCILGDFNLPQSAWSVNNLSSTAIPLFNSSLAESESLDILSNMCAFHNLFQSNHVTNHVNSILDLIFLQTLGSLVEKADFNIVQPDLYHPPLTFTIYITKSTDQGLIPQGFYRDFKNADYNSIVLFMSAVKLLTSDRGNVARKVSENYQTAITHPTNLDNSIDSDSSADTVVDVEHRGPPLPKNGKHDEWNTTSYKKKTQTKEEPIQNKAEPKDNNLKYHNRLCRKKRVIK
ncbi:hypothetical protein JTB14_001553 [Gonioctena quinquepunctata]|nr:hypothetical protein JTB14_001553 [Gonioctena quinquepunctata]